jgi:hypothetical protein
MDSAHTDLHEVAGMDSPEQAGVASEVVLSEPSGMASQQDACRPPSKRDRRATKTFSPEQATPKARGTSGLRVTPSKKKRNNVVPTVHGGPFKPPVATSATSARLAGTSSSPIVVENTQAKEDSRAQENDLPPPAANTSAKASSKTASPFPQCDKHSSLRAFEIGDQLWSLDDIKDAQNHLKNAERKSLYLTGPEFKAAHFSANAIEVLVTNAHWFSGGGCYAVMVNTVLHGIKVSILVHKESSVANRTFYEDPTAMAQAARKAAILSLFLPAGVPIVLPAGFGTSPGPRHGGYRRPPAVVQISQTPRAAQFNSEIRRTPDHVFEITGEHPQLSQLIELLVAVHDTAPRPRLCAPTNIDDQRVSAWLEEQIAKIQRGISHVQLQEMIVVAAGQPWKPRTIDDKYSASVPTLEGFAAQVFDHLCVVRSWFWPTPPSPEDHEQQRLQATRSSSNYLASPEATIPDSELSFIKEEQPAP